MLEKIFSGSFDCALPPSSVRLAQDDRRIETRNVEMFLFDDPFHQNVCPMLKKKLKW